MQDPSPRFTFDAAPPVRERIAAAVSGHRVLSDVVRWGASRTPRAVPLATVEQDEYTHDVVVPFEPGSFVVYGVT